MTLTIKSKREHCPSCAAVVMHNYVLVRPGKDVDIFVECAACGAFVARYTLNCYTCEDPYRSYLRLMRRQPMSSGSATKKQGQEFIKDVWEDYKKVKSETAEHEDHHQLEDILTDVE